MEGMIGLVAAFLPKFTQTLTDPTTGPTEKNKQLTLSFLPLARQLVKLQGQNSDSYDTEKYLEQVDASDRVVPSIMDSVDQVISSFPSRTSAPLTIPDDLDIQDL